MSLGKLMQAFAQCLILRYPPESVLLRTSWLSECPARPPLAHAQRTLDMRYGVTVRSGRQNFVFNASLTISRSSSFSARSF